jgi:hypothetical protein
MPPGGIVNRGDDPLLRVCALTLQAKARQHPTDQGAQYRSSPHESYSV